MRGVVSAWDGDLLTIRRQFSGGGLYDSLNVPKLNGDWGTIEVPQGGRVLRRAYFRRDAIKFIPAPISITAASEIRRLNRKMNGS